MTFDDVRQAVDHRAQQNYHVVKKRKEQPVTFADVEGVGDAKAELLKVIRVKMVNYLFVTMVNFYLI